MPALELFPYQLEGAAFLSSKARAALFDEPGVGKTAQAIRALDDIGARRCLVVCPAAVREVWATEFRKFSYRPRKIIKGKDINDLNLWLRGKVDVLLLSYEMARTWAKRMEGDLIDAIVFDEAHYLRNKSAQWTVQLLGADCDGRHGLAKWAVRCFFLTGTPNYNDPADIWSILRFCRATPCSARIFADRYFTKRVGTFSTSHVVRDAMLPELKLAIKSCSIRRTERDTGVQRPPVWLTTVNVEGDTQEIRSLLRAHPNIEKAIVEAVEKGGLSFLEAQHVMTLRRLVGEAKAVPYAEMLAEEFRGGRGKTVIGCLHTKAMDTIAEVLKKHGYASRMFRGATTDRQRTEVKEAWAEDPDLLALIVQLKAGGEGQTFIAGHDADLFESAWTPTQNVQFFKRVHRQGQTEGVNGRHIILSNSVDDVVAETVLRKTRELIKLGTFSELAA